MSHGNTLHSRTSLGLGDYLSHRLVGSVLEIEAERGWCRIDAWAAQTVRVRMGRHSEPLTPNDGLLLPVEAGKWVQVIDESERLVIEANWGSIEVGKKGLLLKFLNSGQSVIHADDPVGTRWIGTEVTAYKALQPHERFLGLGEKTGPLDKRGRAYVNCNTDHFGYGPDSDPLYASIPFYIGIHDAGIYGIFLNNTFKSTFNFGASSDRFAWFSIEDGAMDYFVFMAPEVAGLLRDYSALTGRMPMPPKWALGFQQCRYSYYPDTEVLRVARTFREKKIPADAIYLDIHYMEDFKVFSWHGEYFKDPKGLCEALRELGFRLVVILDPGIKVEPGYEAYDTGLAEGHFAILPDGKPYSGQVWPGWSHFPDFTAAATRKWWGDRLGIYTEAGIEGFWNDMNEPATWGQHMPHLIEFDMDGRGGTFKEARNLYGQEMARATLEGAQALRKDQRIFNLTRAGFAGIQRYSAVWTGDNTASEAHMMAGQRLVNSLGLSGVAFAGCDIGGFVGEPSPALYARWMALGAFSPLFRAHSMINSRDSEPWAFGEEVEDIARNYIRLRYQLMPYLYSAFYEAATTGMPVARSLAIEWPQDPMVYNGLHDSTFLFGSAILVAPVESHKELAKVYLPEGSWYSFYDDTVHLGGVQHVAELNIERLPLYVRAGAVVPMQVAVLHTDQAHDGVLHLHVYGGESTYEGSLYDDDGHSHAYLKGEHSLRTLTHDGGSRKLMIGAQIGTYKDSYRRLRIHFHGIKGVEARLNGQARETSMGTFRIVDPVSRFDPFMPPVGECLQVNELPFIECDLSEKAILIEY